MNKVVISTTFSLALLLVGVQFATGQSNPEGKKVIEMTNSATYNPAELIISQGEQITWQNKSSEIQTITVKTREENDRVLAIAPPDAEPFSSGSIQPGDSFSYTFYISGTYEFVSLPHQEHGTSGRIVVKD